MARTVSIAVILLIVSSALRATTAADGQPAETTPAAQAAKPPAGAEPGEPKQEAKGHRSKKEKGKVHAPESKEAREQRVISFVEQQNPELAKVLAHLKRRKSQEYDKALRELAETVTTLSNVKARDAHLYELELKSWQAKTRVEMLAAQLMVGKKEARANVEAKLREAVSEELKLKAKNLAYRKEKSVAWYDRQIKRLEENRDELVEARIKKFLGQKEGKPKAKRGAKADSLRVDAPQP